MSLGYIVTPPTFVMLGANRYMHLNMLRKFMTIMQTAQKGYLLGSAVGLGVNIAKGLLYFSHYALLCYFSYHKYGIIFQNWDN